MLDPSQQDSDDTTQLPEFRESAPYDDPTQPNYLTNGSDIQSHTQEIAEEPIFFDNGTAPTNNSVPAGPGFWESILWIVGLFAIELFGGFIWGTGAVVLHGLRTGQAIDATDPAAMQEIIAPQLPYLLAVTKFAEVLFALIAIRFRYGITAFQFGGFRPIPWLHIAVIVLCIIPIAVCSGQFYAILSQGLNVLSQSAPFLEDWDDMSSMNDVQEMTRNTPAWLLIFAIAVLPALNEELLFRGLIGRGLVSRYSYLIGIAITSFLFAAVHLSPVHAVALLPLAVVMHVAYISSGSIWLAVVIHFINNALSVGMMLLLQYFEDEPVPVNGLEDQFDLGMLIASVCCVTALVWVLWQIRVRWEYPDGVEWRPPQLGVVAPSHFENVSHRSTPFPVLPSLALAASLGLFLVAYGVNAVRISQQQENSSQDVPQTTLREIDCEEQNIVPCSCPAMTLSSSY